MRILIFLLCLGFYSCKTPQFNTEYTIDYADITLVQNCDTYIYKLKNNNTPLDGLYKIVNNKGYSIAKYKNGLLQSKKGYIKHKLLYSREQLKSDTSIFIEYYDKKISSFWSSLKPYDSIHTYFKNYPIRTNLFYKGNKCEYMYNYDDLDSKLTVVVTGCKLKYLPSALESAILNTECINNPLTYNTKEREFSKEIKIEIINLRDTIYLNYELKEDRYRLKF